MGDEMESDFSFPDIPRELLIEILIYLPVKSLIRFTCVCKFWLYLIRSDRQFAIRHYLIRSTLSSNLMDNADLIVDKMTVCKSIGDEEVARLCMYSLTERRTFRIEKKIEFGPGLCLRVSNFCHGIMCIYVYRRSNGSRFLLYNPAIQEVVTLPLSPNFSVPKLGLGFDSTSNDYKILAIRMPSLLRDSCLVDVYSVRNGRWHSIKHQHAIAPLEKYQELKGAPVLNDNGRILHFVSYHRSKRVIKRGIMTFDMVDEVFRETSAPEGLSSPDYERKLLPSSRVRACLCCFTNSRGSDLYNVIVIWVLLANGHDYDQALWNKQATIRFPDMDPVWPLNIWVNDKELLVWMKKEGNLQEVFLYDAATHQFKRTGRRGAMRDADAYTESLVSIKGLIPSEARIQRDVGDDGVYFVREISKRNHWSHSFNII